MYMHVGHMHVNVAMFIPNAFMNSILLIYVIMLYM